MTGLSWFDTHRRRLLSSMWLLMTTALIIIYFVGLFLFSVAFLVDWIRSYKRIRRYLKYGIYAGLVILGLDLLLVVITAPEWTGALLLGLSLEAIMFTRAVGVTMLGMHHCASMGHPSFPLLLRSPMPEDNTQETNPNQGTNADQETAQPALPEDAPPLTAAEPALSPVQVDWRKLLAGSLGVAAAGVLYTVGLFLLTKPHLSETAERAFGVTPYDTDSSVTIQVIVFSLAAAVAEEVIFRLGIQSFLARHLRLQGGRYWLAIVFSATLWTAGHAGSLTPDWVKLAQVFPVGLMLGWLFRKYGAESSILAHGLFNVILLFLATRLIE